jgi:hypothetical protein
MPYGFRWNAPKPFESVRWRLPDFPASQYAVDKTVVYEDFHLWHLLRHPHARGSTTTKTTPTTSSQRMPWASGPSRLLVNGMVVAFN